MPQNRGIKTIWWGGMIYKQQTERSSPVLNTPNVLLALETRKCLDGHNISAEKLACKTSLQKSAHTQAKK